MKRVFIAFALIFFLAAATAAGCMPTEVPDDSGGETEKVVPEEDKEDIKPLVVIEGAVTGRAEYSVNSFALPFGISKGIDLVAIVEIHVVNKASLKEYVFRDKDVASPVAVILPDGKYMAYIVAIDRAGKSYRISDPSRPDKSFSVEAQTCTLKLISPNRREHFLPGVSTNIIWSTGGMKDKEFFVKIELLLAGGRWQEIASHVPAERLSYHWRLPEVEGEYKLRLTAKGSEGKTVSDESDDFFFIRNIKPEARITTTSLDRRKLTIYFSISGVNYHEVERLALWSYSEARKTWKPVKEFDNVSSPIVWDAPEGVVYLAMTAKTTLGHERPLTVKADAEVVLEIDDSAPSIAVGGLKNFYNGGETVNATLRLSGSGQIALASVRLLAGDDVYLDIPTGNVRDGRLVIDIPVLTDLDFLTLRIEAVDENNRVGVFSRNLIIDSKKPVLKIAPHDGYAGSTEVSFVYSAWDEGLSGLGRISVWLFDDITGDRMDVPQSSPFPGLIRLKVPDGTYRMAAIAEDNAGNLSSSPTKFTRSECPLIVIDSTPPQVEVVSYGTDTTERSGAPVGIEYIVSDANLRDNGVSIFASADGGKNWFPIAESFENTGRFEWKAPDVECGSFFFKVVALDLAGNSAGDISNGALIVYNYVPAAVAVGPETSADSRVLVEYTIEETAVSDIATVTLFVRRAGDKNWTEQGVFDPGKKEALVFNASEDALWEIHLATTDSYGNKSVEPNAATPPQLSVLVDTIAPKVAFSSFRDTAAHRGGVNEVVAWQGVEANLSSRGVVLYFMDVESPDGKWVKLASGLDVTGSFAFSIPTINTQSARLKLSLADRAGNTAEAITPPFIIDSLPPLFEVSIPPSANRRQLEIFFTARDNFSEKTSRVTLWYSKDLGETWQIARENVVSPVTFVCEEDTEYKFHISGEDGVGNRVPDPEKGSPGSEVRVDTQPPHIELLTFAGENEDAWFPGGAHRPIKWVAEDPNLIHDRIVLEFSDDGGTSFRRIAPRPVFNDGEYMWRLPPAEDAKPGAVYKVRVSAKDSFGNTGYAETEKPFRIDPSPPVFILKQTEYVSQESAIDVPLGTDDGTDGSGAVSLTIKYRKTGERLWQSYPEQDISSGSFRFSAADGTYELFLIVSDRAGNNTGFESPLARPHLTLTIDTSGPTIRLKSFLGGGVYRARGTYSVVYEADDECLGVEPLTIEAFNGEKWVVIDYEQPNTGEYLYTVVKFEGIEKQKIRVTATDLSGKKSWAESPGFYYVDDTPPVVEMLSGKGTRELTTSIEYEGRDVGRAGFGGVSLWVSGDRGRNWREVARSTEPKGSLQLILPKEGQYLLYFQSYDNVGNERSIPDSLTRADEYLIADSNPPELELVGFPLRKWYIGGAPAEVTWRDVLKGGDLDLDTIRDTVRVELSTDEGGNWAECIVVGTDPNGALKTTTFLMPTVDVTAAAVRLSVADSSGNRAAVVSTAFGVDSKAPQATATGYRSTAVGSAEIFCETNDWRGSGVKSLKIYYMLADGQGYWEEYPEVFTNVAKPLVFRAHPGTYKVSVVASDFAGNVESAPVENSDYFEELSDVAINPEAPAFEWLDFGERRTLSGGAEVVLRWRVVKETLRRSDISIDLSLDGGATWHPVAANIGNIYQYRWIVPRMIEVSGGESLPVDSDNCLLRLTARDEHGQVTFAHTPGAFSIDSSPPRVRMGKARDWRKGITEYTPSIEKGPPPLEPVKPPVEDDGEKAPQAAPDDVRKAAEAIVEGNRLLVEWEKADAGNDAALALSRLAEARTKFEDATKLDPRNPDGYGGLALAVIFGQAGPKTGAEALKLLEESDKYGSRDFQVYYHYAGLLGQNGEYIKALEAARKAETLCSEKGSFAEVKVALTKALWARRLYDEAVKKADEILALDPAPTLKTARLALQFKARSLLELGDRHAELRNTLEELHKRSQENPLDKVTRDWAQDKLEEL